MQTTLLGLGIAIILAIVAALAAPFVVDWNHYRSAFEVEASRLTGMSVRVNGTIDARILPTPLVKLRNVEVGETGREPRLRVGTLELELSLGPLFRGRVQASKANLIAPQISLGLDRSGTIDWPAMAPSFHPEALSISRLNVEDGRIILADAASGARLMLQKISFDGDIRSFVGPFKGEGGFVAGDESYSYRVSGGPAEADGGTRIKLDVNPSNQPLTTDIDGVLKFDRGVPQFDGALALARPVGATLANGRRVMSDPWHAVGKILLTPASASLQSLAFQYGPDERPINFTGKAELKFGARPQLEGAVTALQVNVDRALADPDATHRPPLLVIKNFLEAFVAAVKPPMAADVGIGIDAVTVGGATIQSLYGNVRFDDNGWSLNGFEFHAPGQTKVNVSGRLNDGAQGLAFSGPSALESADVNMLLAWLGGRSATPSDQAKTLSAQGDIALAGDRLSIDRLTAAVDHETVEGRLAYTWATAHRPAVLDADLRAANLDLDAVAAFGKAAAGYGLELPRAGALVLAIGKATSAGVDARMIEARIKFDAGALQIDRLSVGALDGAALDISGRIDELSSQPRGRVTLDLDARALTGLTNVVAKFAPQAGDVLRRFGDRLTPAKVHAILTVEHAASAGSVANINLDGQLGLMHVGLKGDATAEPSRLGDAQVHVDGRVDADDGTALAALIGLDRVVALDQLPGSLTLSAMGPLNGELRVDVRIVASGIDGAARGALRLGGDGGPTGTFQVVASAADLRPLQQAATGQAGTAVPVSARAAVAIAGSDLKLTDIAVTAGRAALHGRLALDLASRIGIDGDIALDNPDAATVAALLLGLPRKAQDAAGVWSSDPVGAGAFAAMSGAVTFKLNGVALTPTLVARDLKGVARFAPAAIDLADLDGRLAGGHLTGDLAFRRNADGLVAYGDLALAGADAAPLLQADQRNLDGLLTLQLQCESIGASPVALIRALHGSGTLTVADVHIAGVDVAAFDAAIRAADQDSVIQAAKIQPAKIQAAVSAAMANGHLIVAQGDAALTITGGNVSVANATFQARDGAAISLAGALDLNNGLIDAHTTLTAHPPAHALISMRPELGIALKGPLAEPARTFDTAALVGWLTLRATELQTRRLESIEANGRVDVAGPVSRPEFPAVRTAPAGALLEFKTSAAAALSARGIERLQPQAPPVAAQPIAPQPTAAQPAAAPPLAPQSTAAQPAAPSPAPNNRSLLDFLFRSQN